MNIENVNGVKLGADPECFVINDKGALLSAHGLVPGTKAVPHKVDNGAVQLDGHAAEFNISAASNKEEFVSNIRSVMDQLTAILPKGYSLSAQPVAEFGNDYLSTFPEEANEMGCEPDFEAWSGEPNPRPNAKLDFRTGAGHVHIGWTEGMDVDNPDHIEACRMLTKELDFYLGLVSLLWDRDCKRRTMYGMPSTYRVKSYGVEYRSLSNAWLQDSRLMALVYDLTIACVNNMMSGDENKMLHISCKEMAKSLMKNDGKEEDPVNWPTTHFVMDFIEYVLEGRGLAPGILDRLKELHAEGLIIWED